ncbi:MAG: dihydroneopterin aldolase [Bacteroidales bacterium]|nr:dihydroneopterin aldolase [Bacteroidales bacterium]MCF8455343.1 dihydroneopterin aldolase [Bacteroidales bacterium]
MGLIQIEDMEFYAFHGHFKEEQIVGNKFLVDISLDVDCTKPAESDSLKDAVDYQKVYRLIKHEMTQKSFLLENICKRLLDVVFQNFPEVRKATIKVRKMNPPMGGRIGSVSVMLEREW